MPNGRGAIGGFIFAIGVLILFAYACVVGCRELISAIAPDRPHMESQWTK